MNFKWNFKWLKVPETNETKEVQAVQTWEVRWTSRYDVYSYSTQPEMEVFTSEILANEFATSLRNAFKLVKYTAGTETSVVVSERK